MSVDSAVKDLLSRLEKVTARLEHVERDLASGAKSGGGGGGAASASAPSGPAAAFVDAYQGLIDEFIKPYVEASKKIDADVAHQAELVLSAVNAQRTFLEVASQSKKPDAAGLQKLIAATSKAMGEVSEFREANRKSKFFNNLSGISEGIGALGWVVVEKTPGPFVNEGRASSEFYTNKLLTAHKNSDKDEDKIQVDWVKHWNGFLRELFTYIKANHTTGVSWNPAGGDGSAASVSAAPAAAAAPAKKDSPAPAAAKKGGLGSLFGEINAVGAGAKPTLNKVTKDMKTSNQKDKSSVVKAKAGGPQAVVQGKLNLNGNKWEVEDWKGGDALVIDQTEPKHVLYIYNCERKTIQIKGKINNITLDKCKRVSIVFETAIAAVECVNCTSLEIQCVNTCPTYTVDSTSGFLLYIGAEGKKFELTQSKSAEINIMMPGATPDVDQVELNVPDQFVSSVGDDGKLVTRPMVHTG
jgi:adenylyl cyclase-associated protein